MKVSRRRFLVGVSVGVLIIVAPTISRAWTHGAGIQFNNGRSQVNLNGLRGGDFAFLNLMKEAPAWGWFSGNSAVTPDVLDANGWPTATTNGVGSGGVSLQIPIPTQVSRPGNYIMTWDGTGTISAGAGGSTLTSKTFTGSISGNVLAIPGSITGGPFQYGEKVQTNSGNLVLPNTIIINQIDSTHYTVSKSQTVASAAMTANGGSASSSGTTDAGFQAVTVSSSTFVFRITTLPSAPSNYISNVKLFHVDDAAALQAGQVFGTKFKQKLIEANFGVIRFLLWQGSNSGNLTTWASRPPTSYFSYGAYELRQSLYCGVTTNVSNDYTVAAPTGWLGTSGGKPTDKQMVHVLFNASASAAPCTMTITGGAGGDTGAISILGETSNAINSGSAPIGGTFASLATMVYDATLNAWIKQGGDQNLGSYGIFGNVPPELCLQLCREVGAHPWFSLPMFAADPMTDYVPELANYIKTNGPSWMTPRFETVNESWNAATWILSYSNNKAAIEWSGGVNNDWQGKTASTLGQAIAAVYTLGNLGTTYQVIDGMQTATGGTAGGCNSSNDRLSAAKYVAQAASAQSLVWSGGTINFTKSAASGWVSHICVANYMSPLERYTTQELIDAYSYSITNSGNATAQAALANGYVDTLLGAAGNYNLAQLAVYYSNWKTWAAGFGVNKMCCYEGGYSPDYIEVVTSGFPSGIAWSTAIMAASKASSCVLTLSSTSSTTQSSGITGNPAVVGMAAVLKSAGGMTQLNNPAPESVTFSSGGSANINGANTLVLNQAVYFYGTLPSELTANINLTTRGSACSLPYYVVSVGNPFQISATRGGSAITFATTGSGVTAQEAWFISAVAGSAVTLDVDSTAFTTYTSGGTLGYADSQTYSNNLRYAGKQASNLQGYLYGGASSNYKGFTDAGGEFPACFQFTGKNPSDNVWSVLEDIYQTPNPPQWAAIIAFNH
jgi:hypothetical protein